MPRDASTEGPNNNEGHEQELVRVAHGAGVIFAGKILGGALQYIYIIVIARILGVKTFGLFMLGTAIINFTGIIGRLGLENGVIRFIPLYEGEGDRGRIKGTIIQSFKYSFIASVVMAAVLFFAAGPLSTRLFHKPGLEGIIQAFSISIPFFTIMMIALASTQGFKIMKYTVYSRNLLWPVSNLLLMTIFFFLGFRLYGAVVAYIITVVFAAILSLYFLFKTFSDIRSTKAISENSALFRFSLPLLFVLFMNFAMLWTDTLMLGFFALSKDVGIYNAAMKTAMQTSIILVSFNSIFAPVLSDLYNKGEMEKLEKLYKVVTKWIYSASFPVFLLLLLLSNELMLLFGHDFGAGRTPLIILALAQLVNAGVGPVGVILVMSGKQNIMMYNTAAISILNISLNWFLIPIYGITGAALATGISTVALNIVMLLEVYLIFGIHPHSKKFIKPSVIGIIAYGVLLFIINMLGDIDIRAKLLIVTPLFLAVFVSMIYAWGIDDEDRYVLSVFKGRFRKSSAL